MNISEFLAWLAYYKGKVLAVFISCIYVSLAAVFGEQDDWIKILLFLLLPLACIFFSEAMGGYEGFAGSARPSITNTSPGCFVLLLGWILLLIPLFYALFAVLFP